jgi:CHAT domain-containing protein/tetratricopeptide (TPR) repeat protein
LKIRETQLGKNHLDVAVSLNNLAAFYESQGQYALAEPLYRRSLQIRTSKLGKDHPAVATVLGNLAVTSWEMGHYAQVGPLYERSLRIEEAALGKDHPAVALTLYNMAVHYHGLGQPERAEPLLRRCLTIVEAKVGKDHPRLAGILNAMGCIAADRRDVSRAEMLFRRARRIYATRFGKDHPSVATAGTNLANLYWQTGHYRKAKPLLEDCLAVMEAKKGKNHPDVARSLFNLASVYQSLDQADHAAPLLRRCLEIQECKLNRNHPRLAKTLSQLGTLYASQGKWDRALDSFDRARRIHRHFVTAVLPALSVPEQLKFLKTRYDPELYQALSFALRRRADAGTARRSAGWVLNSKAVAQEVLGQRSLVLRDLGDGRLRQTTRELVAVRARLAQLTFAGFPSGQQAGYLKQVEQLTARERSLSKRLGEAAAQTARADWAAPWVELSEVRRVLPDTAVFIDFVRLPVWDFQARGREKQRPVLHYVAWVVPGLARGEVRVIDLGPAEKIEAAVAAVRKAFGEAPPSLRRLGEVKAEQELTRTLRELAGLLLAPLEKDIGQRGQWILSPDASLWLVPWAALPLADGRYALEKHRIHYLLSGRELLEPAKPGKTARPLVIADPDFDLQVVKPETKYMPLQETEPAGQRALSWVSGALGSVRFKRLGGTAAEARAIAPALLRYTQKKCRVYTGKEALESIFKKAKQPQVVVLSTHGFFLGDQDEALVPHLDSNSRGLKLVAQLPVPAPGKKKTRVLENPLLRCGLALAGANRRDQIPKGADDGILTGLEIVGTDLRGCELVVLSACETGLGQVRNGEGVAGLRQAFQLAGAQSVVATLWQIPDKETTALMTAFFENLAAKKGKAEALRLAQLNIIKERRAKHKAAHPFYWAAFTLTGRWQ